MSGRGKGKSSKKAVSRSAKAGLQFPVGRIARYVLYIVYYIQGWRERDLDELEMMECDRSSNNKILKLQTLTLINSLFP